MTNTPPLDYVEEDDQPTKRNPLLVPVIAAAITIAAVASLYLAPFLTIAFAAGILTAVWFDK